MQDVYQLLQFNPSSEGSDPHGILNRLLVLAGIEWVNSINIDQYVHCMGNGNDHETIVGLWAKMVKGIVEFCCRGRYTKSFFC